VDLRISRLVAKTWDMARIVARTPTPACPPLPVLVPIPLPVFLCLSALSVAPTPFSVLFVETFVFRKDVSYRGLAVKVPKAKNDRPFRAREQLNRLEIHTERGIVPMCLCRDFLFPFVI